MAEARTKVNGKAGSKRLMAHCIFTPGMDGWLDDLDAAGLLHDGSYRTEADSRRPVIINTPNGRVGFISAAEFALGVSIADQRADQGYTMRVDARGTLGFVTGSAAVELAAGRMRD